jgi:hypothetical protein
MRSQELLRTANLQPIKCEPATVGFDQLCALVDVQQRTITFLMRQYDQLLEMTEQEAKDRDLVVYSLDEKRVGTWIDGRPVFQKTFKADQTWVNPPNPPFGFGTLFGVQHGIDNFDYLIEIIGGAANMSNTWYDSTIPPSGGMRWDWFSQSQPQGNQLMTSNAPNTSWGVWGDWLYTTGTMQSFVWDGSVTPPPDGVFRQPEIYITIRYVKKDDV